MGSSATARASATRRAIPPESSEGINCACAAQAHGVQLHQHQITHQLFREIGMLAQCERDILEHRHVGEQRTELKQHPELAPHLEQSVAIHIGHRLLGDQHPARARLQLTADQAQDRRLATAGAAHDRHDFPARDSHGDAFQDNPGVVSERDVAHFDGKVGQSGAGRIDGRCDGVRH
jgi:hypothetical protein